MTSGHDAWRFAALIQKHCDELFRDLPDKVRVALEPGQNEGRAIRFSYESWTAALVRARIDGREDLHVAAGELGIPHPLDDDVLAHALADHLFGRAAVLQRNRNAAARRFGLEREDGWVDLPLERLLVDRALYRLLDGTRTAIPLMAYAARLQPHGRCRLSQFEVASHCEGVQSLSITQRGVALPIVWSSCSIGRARYDGSTLELPGVIPETVAALAVGRPVGDLVETGHPDVDCRRMLAVEATEEWEPDLAYESGMRTRIRFKRDLAPIGDLVVRRAKGSGKRRRRRSPFRSDADA